MNKLLHYLIFAAIVFSPGPPLSARERAVETFLRVNAPGIALIDSEAEWVYASQAKKRFVTAAALGELLGKLSSRVKESFRDKYKDRDLVRIVAIPEVIMAINPREVELPLIQFKAYYRIKNVVNLGTPACIGYLVRSDGKIREQGSDSEEP